MKRTTPLDWMISALVPLEPGEVDEQVKVYLERFISGPDIAFKDLSERDKVKTSAIFDLWLRDNDPEQHHRRSS